MLYQQGDVLIETTENAISSDYIQKRDRHLAEGEVTGHFLALRTIHFITASSLRLLLPLP